MNTLKPLTGSVVMSTTFEHKKPGQMGYSRVDNPTRLEMEGRIARLEGGRFALVFSSGSAALSAVFSLLSHGDTVMSHKEVYEGTVRMLEDVFSRFGIHTSVVDFADSVALRKGMKKAQMLVCETVTNPTLSLVDIQKIGRLRRSKDTLLVVDNTMASPVFSKPLAKGADIAVESLTKFISGHHDVMMGAVVTNRRSIFERLRKIQWTLGAVPGAQDCFLVMRGMETLGVRMAAHKRNALIVSRFLRKHPFVRRVAFPGISGLVSFWLKGNGEDTVKRIMRMRHVRIAHSFGGTSSTLMHPRSMMTWTNSEEELEKLGITGSLVRLSVGIEEARLIVEDLKQALAP